MMFIKLFKDHYNLQKVKHMRNKVLKAQKAYYYSCKKDYLNNMKRYNIIKKKYIKFLKENNLWTNEHEMLLREKSNNVFIMDEYDEHFAIRYSRAKLYKQNSPGLKGMFVKPKIKFGDEVIDNYYFNMELLKTTEHICRVNKWLTRDNWLKHKVPINQLFQNYIKSALDYSEILKYYKKVELDKVTAIHKR